MPSWNLLRVKFLAEKKNAFSFRDSEPMSKLSTGISRTHLGMPPSSCTLTPVLVTLTGKKHQRFLSVYYVPGSESPSTCLILFTHHEKVRGMLLLLPFSK